MYVPTDMEYKPLVQTCKGVFFSSSLGLSWLYRETINWTRKDGAKKKTRNGKLPMLSFICHARAQVPLLQLTAQDLYNADTYYSMNLGIMRTDQSWNVKLMVFEIVYMVQYQDLTEMRGIMPR